MGVYLPNVDMPKDDKVVTIRICPNGSIWQQYRGTVPNAKAVPVPPHGRLGDLEQAVIILERLRNRCNNGDMAYALNWAADTIRDLPTILPAEEGET